jgi:hypothetical protein
MIEIVPDDRAWPERFAQLGSVASVAISSPPATTPASRATGTTAATAALTGTMSAQRDLYAAGAEKVTPR